MKQKTDNGKQMTTASRFLRGENQERVSTPGCGMGKSCMNAKSCLGLVVVVMSCLFLAVGCSSEERDREKAEKFYELGLKAVEEGKTEEAMIQFKNAVQKDPAHARAHYQLGQLHRTADELNAAVGEFNLAIQMDPRFDEAKKTLLSLYFRYRAYAQATDLARDMIETGGEDLETLLILGNSLVSTDEREEGRQVLEMAVADYPANPNPKVSLARVLLGDNERGRAQELMEAAANLNPEDMPAQLLLGWFYERIERFDLADRTMSGIRSGFPGNRAAYLAPARFYMRRNRLEDSETLLNEAIEADMGDHTIYQALALTQHRKRDFPAALENFKEAVAVSPDDQRSAMLLADYYIFLQQLPEAKAIYESIAERWPELTPVKSKIAELLFAERDFGQAQQHIEGLLQESPDYGRAHLLQGILSMREGKAEEARKAFQKARDLDPDSAESHYFYGLTFLEDEEYKLSLFEILQALEKNPNSVKIRLALAFIYLRTGELSLSLDELNRILNARPDNSRARTLRAAVHLQSKTYESAASDYRYLLAKNPESPGVQYQLAGIYLMQGKLEEALVGFHEVLSSYPDPVRPLEQIAKIYVARKQFGQAIDVCDEFLRQNPDHLQGGMIKASVYLSQREYEEAERELSELMRKNPESDLPLSLMARAYRRKGDMGAEQEMYQRVVALNPENVDAHLNLARIHNHSGDRQKATDAYEAVLEVNGSHAAAANDLAFLYADANRKLDRALALALKAKELLPDNPSVADTLGWVYMKRGSAVMAKKYLRQAVLGDPGNPTFHYHLGRTYHQENDFSASTRSLQEAMRIGLGETELAIAERLLDEMSDLSSLYAEMDRDLDRALELAQQARELRPDSPEVSDILGQIHLKRGSPLLARRYLSEAIRTTPQNPIYHYHMGLALHQERNYADATKELQQAIIFGLGDEEAEEARRLLDEMK